MSKVDEKIKQLRSELELLNKDLFSLIAKRRVTSSLIQEFKDNQSEFFPNWDPKREWSYFSASRDQLILLNFKELLAYSLFIETHAQEEDELAYPSWSESEHLQGQASEITQQINPILMKVLFAQNTKGIKENFQRLMDMVELEYGK